MILYFSFHCRFGLFSLLNESLQTSLLPFMKGRYLIIGLQMTEYEPVALHTRVDFFMSLNKDQQQMEVVGVSGFSSCVTV